MELILVDNPQKGIEKAKEILYKEVDKKTVLFLSGGRTPKELYESLATEQKLEAGAVGLIDERFGPKNHDESNELMIENAGLLKYLKHQSVPFYPILHSHPGEATTSTRLAEAMAKRVGSHSRDSIASLQNDNGRIQTAQQYDTQVRDLLFKFPKSVGILGIGLDGHTAGIPSQNSKLKTQNLKFDREKFVVSYNDETGKYGERITMTFTALSMLDTLIVIVLGKDKAQAIKKTFQQGSLEEIPARFYQQPEISKKTILITDQKV